MAAATDHNEAGVRRRDRGADPARALPPPGRRPPSLAPVLRGFRRLPVAAVVLLTACATPPDPAPPPAEPALPGEAELSRDPAPARDWAARVTADDPVVRAAAQAELIRGGPRALPLLKRFLQTRDQDLHAEAFEIARRIGPDAIPLLAGVLRHGRTPVRRQAVDALIDLAPDTEPVQPALARALGDADPLVARDAARALGALRKRAAPSVPALTAALAHADEHVRLYAAEALASVGPAAAPATERLAAALGDPVPGVRWAACEALAGIGPPAARAVPHLIRALADDVLYVRLCAAGALGAIGPEASPSIGPLRAAAADPALRAEAQWALGRITRAGAPEPGAAGRAPEVAGRAPGGADPPWPAPPSPPAPPATAPPPDGLPPLDWDPQTGRNITWVADLGGESFGRPVVAADTVYVGTDNARRLNRACPDPCGVLMAFGASDGQFLWQDVAPRVAQRGLREFLLPSTTSAPFVDGDRLYYVTAECQLRCLDTRGFRDGENDGPFAGEPFRGPDAADVVWELDLCARLGVFPHEASNSEVLPVGDLLVVCTSNGRNEGHTRVPSPRAPSLVAVDKRSGDVVWRAVGPGADVLHGQWSSPAAATVNGRTQVLFGGGDGWLRAYDAASGREIWRFDGNPANARWLPRPGADSRNYIIASPVFADGRVFLAMGQDPSHGDGPSLLHAVSPTGQGDVTGSRRLWTCRDVGRVVGTPVVNDGLLYVGDLGGTVHCLDAATGAVLWKHKTGAPIWGCLLLAGDRLYAGNVDGTMTVFRAGPRKQPLATIEMDDPLYARAAPVGDALYLATARRLYLVKAGP